MDQKPEINQRHLTTLLLLVAGLVIIGIAGYMVIEQWSFLDALYMVVITLATVGYKEIHSLSTAGTIFTILLIVFGVVTLYYVIRVMGEYILATRLDEKHKIKRMKSQIQNSVNHYIVAGFGRVGSKIANELAKENVLVVVVENNPAIIDECRAKGYLCVVGDATSEATLLEAGLMNAKGLIAALGKDSDNILAVITARTLQSGIFIVSKANHDEAVDKLLRVGANRAVSPYQISAFRMATFAMHPGVADFVDNVLDLKNSEIQITDMTVGSASPLVGCPIEKYLANRKSGVSVLVINRQDGHTIINPLGDAIIQAGDRMILMGIRANLEEIEKLIR